MPITKEDIQHIAKLARLELEPQEIDDFTCQFGNILSYIERLDQVNTDNILPMSHPIHMVNAFREDSILPSIPTEVALSNAPEKDEHAFIVPKIVG
ncbi:MAG: Asp-tRNA(Asn)/Glu-tRNA(Gln) amidotransferase subunit GatC [Candidatus Magnetomorum sp.]|nr:Asp-tRNA(Asn)/Glu-tRNA(Gln) amidotransferase subunit GatC [Candidatus Magnetomorum sp.]